MTKLSQCCLSLFVARFLAFGGCFISSDSNTLAQDFHVKGEVEYKYYSTVYTREFEFSVKGTAWQWVIERKLPVLTLLT